MATLSCATGEACSTEDVIIRKRVDKKILALTFIKIILKAIKFVLNKLLPLSDYWLVTRGVAIMRLKTQCHRLALRRC